MKKMIHALTLTAAAVVLAACGGGGGSGGSNPNQPNLLTTAGESVVIPVSAAHRYQISGGVPPYRVGNSDQAIAVGAVNGSELLIGAVGAGNTTVTIYDYSGASVATSVQVGSSLPLYTTAPAALTIGVGASAARTFTVGGGGAPYTVMGSDANVAKVEQISANQWRVTGNSMGSSAVQIRDAAGTEVSVALTVGAPELRLGGDDYQIFVGMEAEVDIVGGQPPYRVAGGIPAAVEATIIGNRLKIKGLLLAELDIGVMDALGQQASVGVEIIEGTGTFRFSPPAQLVSEEDNQPLQFTAFGGVGEVCYFSSNPALLQPQLNGCTTNPQITVDTGTSGSRCVAANTVVQIMAVDANRSVATAAITVVNSNAAMCGLQPFTATQTSFALRLPVAPATALPTAQTFLNNAVGTVEVVSSNPAIATAVLAGGTLTVTGRAAGTATLTLRDTQGRTVTVNVTVS